MAGIGFELRRLLKRENLLGLIQAYGYAGVISSGPWVLSIVVMIGAYRLSRTMARLEYETFMLQ